MSTFVWHASDYVVGAILGQHVDKKLNVIYYASKALDDAQTNNATTEKYVRLSYLLAVNLGNTKCILYHCSY
jgi:hypothetical protein